MSKNADFSETCFSQVNDVGLSMYAVYVVTKNGIDSIHWESIRFTLKMNIIWKSGIVRRTLWFEKFLSSWPVKRTCVYTYTHKWLVCMHSWGNWIALHCFGSLTPIVQSCDIYYTNLVGNIHWTCLLCNYFMNGLLYINKDVWIIDGCWIWCLSWCGVFSPLLELREWHEVVELLGDVIGVYICYVHICCLWIFLHAIGVEFLVKACTFIAIEKCGECMHGWLSHMFTQHMLSRMFTSIFPLTGYLYPYSRWNYCRWQWCSVGIRGDDLRGELVPHVSRVGLGTLHV